MASIFDPPTYADPKNAPGGGKTHQDPIFGPYQTPYTPNAPAPNPYIMSQNQYNPQGEGPVDPDMHQWPDLPDIGIPRRPPREVTPPQDAMPDDLTGYNWDENWDFDKWWGHKSKGGVRFEDIRPDSPAAKAGVKPGDVLLRWDEEDVEDVEHWTRLLGRHKPGDKVQIEVRRGEERLRLTVTLAAR